MVEFFSLINLPGRGADISSIALSESDGIMYLTSSIWWVVRRSYLLSQVCELLRLMSGEFFAVNVVFDRGSTRDFTVRYISPRWKQDHVAWTVGFN